MIIFPELIKVSQILLFGARAARAADDFLQ